MEMEVEYKKEGADQADLVGSGYEWYESIGPTASLNRSGLDAPRKKILGIPTFA